MDIVLTLVVNPDNAQTYEKAKSVFIETLAGSAHTENILSQDCAVDILFDAPSPDAVTSQIKANLNDIEGLDWCLQPDGPHRRKSMLIADMDSTMITVECIDELADFVGLKEKVSLITEAAMRGELDFEDALRERVALLAGLKETDLQTCFDARIQVMSGAKTLVRTMKKNDAYAALVSGGFTFFTERVAQDIGFDTHRANILEIKDAQLSGRVIEPICGAATKLEALHDYCQQLGINNTDVIAVGDGANDIPMINAAGLGVAYHAKPKTAAAAQAAIRYGDLTTLLYFQGYRENEFITA